MYVSENNFYTELKKDLKTWLYFIFINQISRIYFIYSLKQHIGLFNISDFLNILIAGLKYDVVFSSIISFLFTISFSFYKLLSYVKSIA